LGKKVEEIISKLTVLDTLGEKLNKFESTMSKVLANVERVTKKSTRSLDHLYERH